jgi:hypothetical protein
MLSFEEKQEILGNFPNIKLSYESIDHKKVYEYDLLIAIPEGKKCFAWFTIYNNKNICFIFEIKNKTEIVNIDIYNVAFNSELSFGTIFYGTVFNIRHKLFFNIEDVFFYKGCDWSIKSYLEKLKLFKHIFDNELKQIFYNKYFIVFGIPIIKNNFQDMLRSINDLPYPVNCIQYGYYQNTSKNRINSIKYIKPKNPTIITNHNCHYKKEIIFLVKPDIQNDIYHLYTDDGKIYYNIAYIPDYKSSVMMNNLFRNIKENGNLDTLEESDDESEFENDKISKFVFLDKQYNMICTYHSKFKKWVPIKITDNNQSTVTNKELILLEKNK